MKKPRHKTEIKKEICSLCNTEIIHVLKVDVKGKARIKKVCRCE